MGPGRCSLSGPIHQVFMEAILQTFHCELCPAKGNALAEVWNNVTLLLRLWRGSFFFGDNLCFAATKTQFTHSSTKSYLLYFIWMDLHESIQMKSIQLNIFLFVLISCFTSYWSIVESQCCFSFRCTTKWFSYTTHTHTHTHTHTYSFPSLFPYRLLQNAEYSSLSYT